MLAMARQLSAEHEAVIDRLVASGHYSDADHVITEALNVLEAYERQLDELRAKLQVGLDDIARGAVYEYTPELREHIRESARRRAQNGERPSADVLP
jgi:antitoxin ParD1/3/4